MSSERVSSPARDRAAEMSGHPSAVEGPLEGYHHETYVIPLPEAVAGGDAGRGKCRSPRENLLWFDRRCFRSEERLLLALRGHMDGAAVPRVYTVADETFLQEFIEGRTLGDLYPSGEPVPDAIVDQLFVLFEKLADIAPGDLSVERRCTPDDRSDDHDCAGFLERLVLFAEERVYRYNRPRLGTLFDELGLGDGCFGALRERVAGLRPRRFCLLHADLHRENFVVDAGGRLWTIDWELAMFGDPLYDLATHLHLMRYPRWQHRLVAKRWAQVMEERWAGSIWEGGTEGWEEDLEKLLDFKRAQSVFTDVVRATEFLTRGPGHDDGILTREARRVHSVLTAAERPLRLPCVPSPERIAAALERTVRGRSAVLERPAVPGCGGAA